MTSSSEAQLTSSSEAQVWFALSRLEARHWHDVDFNGGRAVHGLYCPDAVFTVGQNRFEGRDNIKAFYEWRRGRGHMTTRHLITNLIVLDRNEPNARLVGSLTVYRGTGTPPFAGANAPILVADFVSDCRRGDGDDWLYASHAIDPIFVGSDVPLSLAIDPKYLSSLRSTEGTRSTG